MASLLDGWQAGLKKTRILISSFCKWNFLIKELIKGYSPGRFTLKFVLVLLALAAIVAGAGNLQKPGEMENVNRKGVDVMIALDVSKSMLAEDIKPNRLERAKQLVNKLME